MTLFLKLLQLHRGYTPLEDFFTEVITHLFNKHPEILLSWCKSITGIHYPEEIDVSVVSQVTFEKLTGHVSDSRVDFVLYIQYQSFIDVIMIESKLGAYEGEQQLLRYAEILSDLENVNHRYLVYITQHYDPKEDPCVSGVGFLQYRWQDFYKFLHQHFERDRSNNSLLDEVMGFMEELGMSNERQLSPADVLALSQMNNLYGFLQETLDSEVLAKFKFVFGSADTRSFQQLQYNRYVLSAWLVENSLFCGLGYFISPQNKFVDVGLHLSLNPKWKGESRNKVIEFMMKMEHEYHWISGNLDNPKAWSHISYFRELPYFLSSDDHVASIRSFFINILDEFSVIKATHPDLPW